MTLKTLYMIRYLIHGAAVLGLLVLFSACRKITGEGPVVTESRQASGFTGIDLEVSGSLHFVPDSVYSVQISAQKNILDIIKTPVDDGVLSIGFRGNPRVRSHEPIVVEVHAPDIVKLGISGSATLYIDKPFYPAHLDMDISGSGDLLGDTVRSAGKISFHLSGSGSLTLPYLEGDILEANISGSGRVRVDSGRVDSEQLHISGSGDFRLAGVEARTATVHSSGSGNAELYLTQQLDVNISGSGMVYYRGNPRITAQISGSGKVHPL